MRARRCVLPLPASSGSDCPISQPDHISVPHYLIDYSFNNHAILDFHETMKDVLDLSGILSPGH